MGSAGQRLRVNKHKISDGTSVIAAPSKALLSSKEKSKKKKKV